MFKLPIPDNEKERLATLGRYSILDTPPEDAFDRITALAARLFDVPVALVSLVDEDRLWFKSRGGSGRSDLPAEIGRDFSFCAHSILSRNVLVVENAPLDPRFAQNPLVTGNAGLKFYAGAPLMMADGTALGSLCLVDFKPRSFTEQQCQILQDLAASVVSEMELRRVLAAASENEYLYRQMFTDNPHPMWVFDLETLEFLDVNEIALTLYGYSRAEFLGLTVLDICPPEDRPLIQAFLNEQAAAGVHHGHQGIWRHQSKSGKPLWMEIAAHSADFGNRKASMVVAQDVTEQCRTEKALRQSEQKLASHIQQTPLAVIELTPDMTLTSWNRGAEATFGYTAEEALGKNALALIVPDEEHTHIEGLRVGVLTHTGGTRSTNYNRTKSGDLILCDWYNTSLLDESGQVIGFAALGRDITEEAKAQERLRRSEAHKAAILETALECIVSIDHDGLVTQWNPASVRTFGYSQPEAIGQSIVNLIIPAPARPEYRQALTHFLTTGTGPMLNQRIELMAVNRNGREFPVELTATIVQFEAAVGLTAYIREISDRRILEMEREELLAQTESLLADALERADYDPLTGLLNHRAFHKRLEEEMETALQTDGKGVLLLVDLENFKFFNDAHGHLAGDDVLRQVAQAFGATCHAKDTLARFGGDEFALLLPGASLADAHLLAESLREAAALVGYRPPGYETIIPFTLSVGIACFPDDAATRTDLLEVADARLRVSKSGGDDDSHARRVRRSLARSVGGFTMLDALVTAVDNKDRYTRRHSEDVMHYSLQIAQELGMDAGMQRVVEIAALLHDVGKIGVPDAILRKPGRLTEEDFEAIKQHPMMGSIIVSAVAGFEETLDAVRHHHERWDGEGYPFGLREEETPLTARLMAVADAYSAMTTDRPYRKGMDPEKALRILEDGSGTQWDPLCIAAFLRVHRRSASVRQAT